MAWKLVRLKPLKPYFFGKQKVFSNTNFSSSEYFPQQTQLLGAVRKYLLETNGYLKLYKDGRYCPKEKREDARKLVGSTKSIDFEEKDDIGIINFLSPMFVYKEEDIFYPIPKDILFDKNNNQFITKLVKTSNNLYLDGYISKKGFPLVLGGFNFWNNYLSNNLKKEFISYDEIFIESIQNGIGLINKQIIEGQFYFKKSYSLEKNYELAFLINLDLENNYELENGFINIGAEGSTFSLKVEDISDSLKLHPIVDSFINYKQEVNTDKLILLSESFYQNKFKSSEFQVTPNKTTLRTILSNKSKVTKSDISIMLEKGSVFYFEKKESFNLIGGVYGKIGFNQYLKYNKKEIN